LHTAAGAHWKSGLERLAAEAAVARAMRAMKDFIVSGVRLFEEDVQ
jgi:hypothetical protein